MPAVDAFDGTASVPPPRLVLNLDLGDPVLIHLFGELDITTVASLLYVLDWLLELGVTDLRINLGMITFMDIAGAAPFLLGGHPLLHQDGVAQLIGRSRHLSMLSRMLPGSAPAWLTDEIQP